MSLPIFKAATVQASPIYLNAELTVRKACDLIKEAARNGARLVAFPEVFIPAYPYWSWIMSPTEGSAFFERLYHNSIDIDGSEVQILCQAAKLNDCYIVIGLNERGPKKTGTLYNTNITFYGNYVIK